jgi:hypothetical protein
MKLLNEEEMQSLLAERDNLLQIGEVRQERINKLESQINDLNSTLVMLNNDMITLKKLLGVVGLEERLKEVEYRVEQMSFDTKEEFVESVISRWMNDNFDIEDHLNDVYDWSKYINYVEDDDLGSKIRDVVRDMEFTVEVN